MIETFHEGDVVKVKPWRELVECEEAGKLHGYGAGDLTGYVEGVELGQRRAHYYRVTSFTPSIPGHPSVHMWFAPWELEAGGQT